MTALSNWANIITDPNEDMYVSPQLEYGMVDQISTNPFAMVNLLAARNRAGSQASRLEEIMMQNNMDRARMAQDEQAQNNQLAQFETLAKERVLPRGMLASMAVPNIDPEMVSLLNNLSLSQDQGKAFNEMGSGIENMRQAGWKADLGSEFAGVPLTETTPLALEVARERGSRSGGGAATFKAPTSSPQDTQLVRHADSVLRTRNLSAVPGSIQVIKGKVDRATTPMETVIATATLADGRTVQITLGGQIIE